MPTPRAFGQKRSMSDRERSELFVGRKLRHQPLDWTQVDYVSLLTALTVAMETGTTLSFAPAQGGIGVAFRVYAGKTADVEFAGSPQELDELLDLVIAGRASGAEDPREVIRMALNGRAAAD